MARTFRRIKDISEQQAMPFIYKKSDFSMDENGDYYWNFFGHIVYRCNLKTIFGVNTPEELMKQKNFKYFSDNLDTGNAPPKEFRVIHNRVERHKNKQTLRKALFDFEDAIDEYLDVRMPLPYWD